MNSAQYRVTSIFAELLGSGDSASREESEGRDTGDGGRESERRDDGVSRGRGKGGRGREMEGRVIEGRDKGGVASGGRDKGGGASGGCDNGGRGDGKHEDGGMETGGGGELLARQHQDSMAMEPPVSITFCAASFIE